MNLTQYFTRSSTDTNHTGSATDSPRAPESTDDVERRARYMAEQICSGFQLHDRRQRREALEAFHAVDRNQFAHLDPDEALTASQAYVDALWAKDSLEKSHVSGGEIDPTTVGDADWERVRDALERRVEVVGMDRRYADCTAEAWRNHKTMEDYWTPFLQAQTYELRAAMDDPDYPAKPKEGLSGFGPVATRYVLAVELHDMHDKRAWEEAIRVMVPYYRAVLEAHERR